MPAVKKLKLDCKHEKTVANDVSVWVGSLIRCGKCKVLKKIIVIKA